VYYTSIKHPTNRERRICYEERGVGVKHQDKGKARQEKARESILVFCYLSHDERKDNLVLRFVSSFVFVQRHRQRTMQGKARQGKARQGKAK
jgi:hypothetical protein